MDDAPSQAPSRCKGGLTLSAPGRPASTDESSSGRGASAQVALERGGEPGYGAWSVRGRVLYIIGGVWSADELRLLSISVLEFVILW